MLASSRGWVLATASAHQLTWDNNLEHAWDLWTLWISVPLHKGWIEQWNRPDGMRCTDLSNTDRHTIIKGEQAETVLLRQNHQAQAMETLCL